MYILQKLTRLQNDDKIDDKRLQTLDKASNPYP